MMKSRFAPLTFFVLFISLFFISDNAEAKRAKLYAIIVCDTDADEIEGSVKADYNHIYSEIKEICRNTKLKPKVKKFKGRKVTSEFMKKIRKLKVKSDDVIVLYWSGHGIRYQWQNDQWPYYDFEHDSQEVSHLAVTQELMNKNPRLLLSIADCCNDYASKSLFPRAKNIYSIENYSTLFLNSSGVYIASASSPGEISFGLNSSDNDMGLPAGGFFTNALLEVIHDEVYKPNNSLSWDLIFTLAIEKTLEYQLRDEADPYIYHTPQYVYLP